MNRAKWIAILMAAVGVFGMAAGIQGWCGGWITWVERAVLIVAAIAMLIPNGAVGVIGALVTAAIFFFRLKYPSQRTAKNQTTLAREK